MKEEKEIYTIEGKDYTVITRTKEDSNSEEIYNILVRYGLEKLMNI